MDRASYNAYHRKYQLNRYHRLRQEAIQDLGGECVRCGTDKDLQFDHIDPITKGFDLAKLWSVRKTLRDLELEKCQLLCKACHFEKTLGEQSIEVEVHGVLFESLNAAVRFGYSWHHVYKYGYII